MQTEIQTSRTYLNSAAPNVQLLNGSRKSYMRFSVPSFMPNRTSDMMYCKVKVSNFQAPYSFFAINETNDELIIDSTAFVLPHGNYSATTLTKTLNSLLISESIVVAFVASTGRLVFTGTAPFTIYADSTCNRVLGIGDVDLNSSGNQITLTNQLNLIATKVLYVKILELNVNTTNTFSGDSKTILAVPVTVPPYSMIEKDNSQAEGYDTVLSDSGTLTVQIVDDRNTPVDFQDQDWTMSVQLDCYYPYFYAPRQTLFSALQNKNPEKNNGGGNNNIEPQQS